MFESAFKLPWAIFVLYFTGNTYRASLTPLRYALNFDFFFKLRTLSDKKEKENFFSFNFYLLPFLSVKLHAFKTHYYIVPNNLSPASPNPGIM